MHLGSRLCRLTLKPNVKPCWLIFGATASLCVVSKREIRARIVEADTSTRDSKQSSSHTCTAHAIPTGTLRMRAVHPQDEDRLRAIL
jgi:hypothetical protein